MFALDIVGGGRVTSHWFPVLWRLQEIYVGVTEMNLCQPYLRRLSSSQKFATAPCRPKRGLLRSRGSKPLHTSMIIARASYKSLRVR